MSTPEEQATGAQAPGDSGTPSPTGAPSEGAPAGATGTEPAAQPVATGEDEAAGNGSHHVVQRDLDELVAKAEKADEYLELAQRTRADFDNFRKRANREAAAAQERGLSKLAKELLPAIDNLDRALAHTEEASEVDANLLSGMKLVYADLLGALGRVGIEPYSPEGEPFDPQYHEAMAQAPAEGSQPGTIVEVYQRGYRLGETVLRPARVVVAG